MLYYYSDGEFLELIPKIGENPEDIYPPKPCIWLTNRSDGYNGKSWKYMYVINENDINQGKLEEYKKVKFCTHGSTRWFRYFDSIKKLKCIKLK